MLQGVFQFLKGFGPSGGGSAVNTPALVVSDNADGTAAVTVSNSTAGTTNTVYYAALTGGAITWTSAGTRVGDGALTASPGAGAFVWYVSSTDGSTTGNSPAVFAAVTNPTGTGNSVYARCLAAVLTTLSGAGYAARRRKAAAVVEGDTLPIVLVVPEQRRATGYVSEGDVLLSLPVVIVYAVDGQGRLETGQDSELDGSDLVFKLLSVVTLGASVPEVYDFDIEYEPAFDSSGLGTNLSWNAVRITYTADTTYH